MTGAARPVQAQIYTWKDANGVLNLSNRPRVGGEKMAAVPGLRTAPVAAPVLISAGSQYEPLIHEHSLLQGVRANLVRAVIQVESGFNPRAISPKGAMGLMQLMPATAARFGVVDPFNPRENIGAGVAYLKQLLTRYGNNEELALAAYNAGPLAVDTHGSRIPPYKETQDYLRRVSALGGAISGAPGAQIYKSVDVVDGQPVVVDGQPVPRYSNLKPAGGNYQEVSR